MILLIFFQYFFFVFYFSSLTVYYRVLSFILSFLSPLHLPYFSTIINIIAYWFYKSFKIRLRLPSFIYYFLLLSWDSFLSSVAPLCLFLGFILQFSPMHLLLIVSIYYNFLLVFLSLLFYLSLFYEFLELLMTFFVMTFLLLFASILLMESIFVVIAL